MHDGTVGGKKLDTDLYLATAKQLTDAMTKGLGTNIVDEKQTEMAFFIRHNLHVFAASKTYSQQKAVGNLLLTPDGKVKSFNDFKSDVAGVVKDYNVNWLRTEYDTTVAGAQMAAKWQDLQRNKATYPYLEYRTVGDDRVRPEHHVLDGKVYAIDDPVWNTIYPPNGWRCRCTVIPSRDKAAVIPESESGKSIAGMIKNPIFQNNVGKTYEVFKDDHPCFLNANGKLSPLAAEKNYGMRSFEKIYKRENDFPICNKMDKAGFDTFWNNKADKEGNIYVKDLFDTNIRFDKDFYNHLFDKPKENRYEFAANFPEVLLYPDEVWDTQFSNARVKDIPTRVYFKFYKDKPICVATQIMPDGSLNGQTMYQVNVNDKGKINLNRRGVLLHKNSR